jgi:hypothetical protein
LKNHTFETNEIEKLNFIIQIPEIEDDKGIISNITIKSDLGNSVWRNGTGTVTSSGSAMTFDNSKR